MPKQSCPLSTTALNVPEAVAVPGVLAALGVDLLLAVHARHRAPAALAARAGRQRDGHREPSAATSAGDDDSGLHRLPPGLVTGRYAATPAAIGRPESGPGVPFRACRAATPASHHPTPSSTTRARRRRQVLARLGRRLRGQPGDVDLILPFDEVVEALGRVGERSLGLRVDRARLDRRAPSAAPRLRPRVPAGQRPHAHALGADRERAAPRPGHAADLRLPDRRHALRARRPPPRVGRARARADAHRRLRDRGAHDGRRRGHDHASPTCR